MEGLDGSHSGLPMLVSKVITNGIGLSTGTEKGTEVALSLDILEREEKEDAEQHH